MASQVYPDDGTGPRVMFRLRLAPSNANWGGKAHGGTVMLDEVVSTCAAGALDLRPSRSTQVASLTRSHRNWPCRRYISSSREPSLES